MVVTMSKSLKVTSSARVFRTPIVPHRVGLLRRRENEPSLHKKHTQYYLWVGGGFQHPGYQLNLSFSADVWAKHTLEESFGCRYLVQASCAS